MVRFVAGRGDLASEEIRHQRPVTGNGESRELWRMQGRSTSPTSKLKAAGTAANMRTPYNPLKIPNHPRTLLELPPRTAAMTHEPTPINRKIVPRIMKANCARVVVTA